MGGAGYGDPLERDPARVRAESSTDRLGGAGAGPVTAWSSTERRGRRRGGHCALPAAIRDERRATSRPRRGRSRARRAGRMGAVIAVDSGGTFTDCVVLDEPGASRRQGAVHPRRLLGRGGRVGGQRGRRARDGPRGPGRVERSCSRSAPRLRQCAADPDGSRVGLITTRGHEDALIVGRTIQKAAGLTTEEADQIVFGWRRPSRSCRATSFAGSPSARITRAP